MKLKLYHIFIILIISSSTINAQENTNTEKASIPQLSNQSNKKSNEETSKFVLGAYGEAIYSRHFYSDNWKRYSSPETYKDDPGFGRVDLPHFVIMLEYDFGKGWKFGTEMEFEHGGVGSAMEIEEEETGEYETEVEKGGEFVLEQMWIEKSFFPALNIRMGHIIVPIGETNQHHLPTEFFGNFRPEGNSTIIPCTWHQTGISIWGKTNNWRYEAQVIPALDAMLFDDNYWIKNGSTSPFEFKIANKLATTLRIDNYSIKNLQLGISGYIGEAGINTLKQDNYSDISALVIVGAFDFRYISDNLIFRGGLIYGDLSDSDKLTAANIRNRKDSPSPRDKVAKNAISADIEAGVNLFTLFNNPKLNDKKLFLFGRYDFYDTMFKTESNIIDDDRFERRCYSAGLNFSPIKQIVIKTEYIFRDLNNHYNDEPMFNIGIAFAGFFIK